MITKEMAANKLCVSPKTLQRYCQKYRNELTELRYKAKSKFLNENCFIFLREKIEESSIQKELTERISKSETAKKMGITPRTLYNIINESKTIQSLLKKAGYYSRQKKFTKEQSEIIFNHLGL